MKHPTRATTARPVWEGHLRLSLVSCPVALYPATSRAGDVAFHLINPATGKRARLRTVDGGTGKEVDRKSLVKGYEIEKERYVLVTEDEIRAVRLESTRRIDIERFVEEADIDRIWWDEPYYLVPADPSGNEAFGVIRETMRTADRVALGRVVMHTRERFVAIEPRDTGMLVTTLRTSTEIRDSTELFSHVPAAKADKRMIDIAKQIIGQMEGKFDPSDFKDRYEDALRALIKSKEGTAKSPSQPETASDDNVIDLMAALQKSLAGADKPKKAAPARKKATRKAG